MSIEDLPALSKPPACALSTIEPVSKVRSGDVVAVVWGCMSHVWAGVFLGGLCGAAGHLDDGGPFDHGGVVGGEALVVAGAASSAGDPGVGALDDPAAGQDLEAFLPLWLLDDLDGDGELALRPVPPVAVVGPVAPDQGQEAPAPGTPEYGHAPEPDGRGITRNRGAALSCLAAC
jgi:hypothetical protein